MVMRKIEEKQEYAEWKKNTTVVTNNINERMEMRNETKLNINEKKIMRRKIMRRQDKKKVYMREKTIK